MDEWEDFFVFFSEDENEDKDIDIDYYLEFVENEYFLDEE